MVNFFTAHWEKCPKCKGNLTYAESEVSFFMKEPLLQCLLITSTYGLQPVTSKYCSKCSNLQALDYFQSPENVNSWECYTCISQSKPEYHTKSGESDHLGAVEKPHISEDECSDDDNETGVASIPLLEASALQSRALDGKSSHYDQEKAGESLAEASLDTQEHTDSKECSVCQGPVGEEILAKLKAHADCRVCFNCILRLSNIKKCLRCDCAYNQEEKTVVGKLMSDQRSRDREIQSQPFARCSCCSKTITLPVHRCADAKSLCILCFLYYSIDTVLGLDVKCKLCGQEAEESFKAAILDIHFSCSTCSNGITIHNIGHVCKDNQLFCQSCLGSLPIPEVSCSICEKTFLNRASLR